LLKLLPFPFVKPFENGCFCLTNSLPLEFLIDIGIPFSLKVILKPASEIVGFEVCGGGDVTIGFKEGAFVIEGVGLELDSRVGRGVIFKEGVDV
jgi:hypothetical protein